MSYTLLVAGSRDFARMEVVTEVLDRVLARFGTPARVIHGGARGADAMGGAWARKYQIETIVYPANWDHDGKAAGYVRNAQMASVLDSGDVSTFFFASDQLSAGTDMMRGLVAAKGGIEIISWSPSKGSVRSTNWKHQAIPTTSAELHPV